MDQFNWGIIGCGNVTGKKSGLAFIKIDDSLVDKNTKGYLKKIAFV